MVSQSQHGATPQPQSFDPLVGSNETKLTTPRSEHDSHDQKNYDEKYLDMNHFFKSGTHIEAGQMQRGWIQKALFLRSGGAKAKAICDEWDNKHYSGYHPEQAKSMRENYKASALLARSPESSSPLRNRQIRHYGCN